MLERTATSLEPCSLQRVLPTTRACLQSRRKLHTTFWQHGANNFELLDACQALMRLPRSEPTRPTQPPATTRERPEPMTASVFLLDFLYPSGASSLLRKLYPTFSGRMESTSRVRKPLSRLYMSSGPDRSGDPFSALDPPQGQQQDRSQMEAEEGFTEHVEESPGGAGEEVRFEDELIDEAAFNGEGVEEAKPALRPRPAEEELADLLRAADYLGKYERIWELYTRLDSSLKEAFRRNVLLVLATSARPLEAWRVNDLFGLYDPEVWDEEVVSAQITAELVSQNISSAVSIFETALKQHGFAKPLDRLIAYGFRTSDWNIINYVWTVFDQFCRRRKPALSWISFDPVPEPASGHDIVATESAAGSDVLDEVDDNPNLVQPMTKKDPESPVDHIPPDEKPVNSRKDNGVPAVDYAELSSIPNLPAILQALFFNPSGEANDQSKPLSPLFRHVARSSLNLFRPADAVIILQLSKDALSYEAYIAHCARENRGMMAHNLYEKYRTLPGVKPMDYVLRTMIDVYYPNNVLGMERLLGDWNIRYPHMDQRAYLKFMNFYGRRGDIQSLMRMVKDYERHFDPQVQQDPKFVRTLMNAHAVRGDPDAARQVMEAAEEALGEPDLMCQNILLKAYTKEGDYDSAINLFSQMYNGDSVDEYTFATMMNMSSWRGDLQFNLELFSMAKEKGIQPKVAMMVTVVEAYCQNDRYTEAERLCVKLTKEKTIEGDYVYLWNTLLKYNAKRRDLTAVNRLLASMSAQGLAYNQDTYSHLLLALLYCRQAHHAMHMLRVARKRGDFEPTADHYALLIAAFLHTKEPHMAMKLTEMMKEMNFPKSAKHMTLAIDALGRWQELPTQMREGKDGQDYLRKALKQFYMVIGNERKGSPDDRRDMNKLYSKMIFVLVQMRDFATIKQIINLHNQRYPKQSTPETLPLKLLHDIMLADFYEKKYDRVKETWNLVLQRTQARGQSVMTQLRQGDTAQKKVMYSQRFRLGDPLKTMQRLYLELGDHQGLIDLIADVRARGFELDSKNWNYHVQALARLKRWRQAFLLCEEKLMPQWLGWYWGRRVTKGVDKLPLEVRRLASNPRRPRPIAHTLLILAKEYMDLEQMTPWSNDALLEFNYLTKNSPKLVGAITTMLRTGSQLESDIFAQHDEGKIISIAQHPKRRPRPPRSLRTQYDSKGKLKQDPLWRNKEGGREQTWKKRDGAAPGRTTSPSPTTTSQQPAAGPVVVVAPKEKKWFPDDMPKPPAPSDDSWGEGGFLKADLPPVKGKGKRKGGRGDSFSDDIANPEDVAAAIRGVMDLDGNNKK
ncbi:hypothetical protein QBC35DRAFT_480293 [Podospora australis]|uniref:Pentatricopeptide repeat-containing protein n=1 Tax=Podospora australis TaxID=1536484 RepID=A0AAN6X5K5_9PEZI|nr:hypothetical protein QBC35DRAFT_480293 [Podospora australis]